MNGFPFRGSLLKRNPALDVHGAKSLQSSRDAGKMNPLTSDPLGNRAWRKTLVPVRSEAIWACFIYFENGRVDWRGRLVLIDQLCRIPHRGSRTPVYTHGCAPQTRNLWNVAKTSETSRKFGRQRGNVSRAPRSIRWREKDSLEQGQLKWFPDSVFTHDVNHSKSPNREN